MNIVPKKIILISMSLIPTYVPPYKPCFIKSEPTVEYAEPSVRAVRWAAYIATGTVFV